MIGGGGDGRDALLPGHKTRAQAGKVRYLATGDGGGWDWLLRRVGELDGGRIVRLRLHLSFSPTRRAIARVLLRSIDC